MSHVKKFLKKDWYVQGFTGTPLLLNTTAWSGMAMKPDLGIGYTAFVFIIEKGYCEMWYLESDLKKMWLFVKNRLAKDSQYLRKLKKFHERIYWKARIPLRALTPEVLLTLNEAELMSALKASCKALTDSANVSHCIEGLSLHVEKKFRKELFRALQNKKEFNQVFSALTTPSQRSFLSQEEHELFQIGDLPMSLRKRAFSQHTKKWWWVGNSYAQFQEFDEEYFEKKLRSLVRPASGEALKKTELMRHLKLDNNLRHMISVIDFATQWQDERKGNILLMIGYVGRVLRELQRRTHIPLVQLKHLGVSDIAQLHTFKDVKQRTPELRERSKGVFFFMDQKGDYAFSGEEYQALKKEVARLRGTVADAQLFHGTTANTGTATGKVALCRDLSSIARVQEGDIIVASMTRPEYMPALKKCVAIVTDEGGITCHAAIVARELGIPCVIGTKVATRILKSGMLIEVRANHGLVRILE